MTTINQIAAGMTEATVDDLRTMNERISVTENMLHAQREERMRLLEFVEQRAAILPDATLDRIIDDATSQAFEQDTMNFGFRENPAYLDEYEAAEL